MIEGWYGDQETARKIQERAKGKIISKVTLEDDNLCVEFEDNSSLRFYDDGQNCCEHRYFSCDGDDLSEFVGAKYIEAFVKDAPDIEEEYEVHEVCFLEVRTSRGSITVSAHNEHNGYYSGFGITVSED